MPTLISQIEAALEHLNIYDHIYPTNYAEEKEAFFTAVDDGEAYDPQYEYAEFEHRSKVAKLLDDIQKVVETPLQQQLLTGLRGKLRMITAVGTPEITDTSKAVYGFPSEETVEKAEEMERPPNNDDGDVTVDTEQLQQAYTEMFDRLGMEYRCKLVDVEQVRNDPLNKQVILPKNVEYTEMRAKRNLVHETTHSVRTYNGMKHGDPALMYGTNGYEIAEEGLPTFNESDVDVFDATVPKITSRVIAVANADKSFHELYRLMRDLGRSKRLAFIRAYRVKRGLTDTLNAGGFIKDHIYFEGYSRLAETPDLADNLYMGKISFEEVDMVDAEPYISRADHIAAFNDVASTLVP